MNREAMKLALEALEIIKASCREGRTAHAENEAAIAQHIIKQALEQPEPEPVAWAISFDGETPYTLWDGGDCALLDIEVQRHGGKARKMPLYTSPPETAELLREIAALSANALDDYKMIQSLMAEREPEPVIDKSAAIRIATSLGWTPKREWQGLTNEDKQIAFDDTQEASGGFWEFADAIEAKLKEKNA